MRLTTKNASSKSKTLVGNILKKMKGLTQPRKKFIISIVTLFLSIRGRYNFKGMERYGELNEKTYRLQFEQDFDFLKFNQELYQSQLSKSCIVAFDPSYLPKSGKHTPHKGRFYSGCLGKAIGGIEIGSLGIIDLENHTAFNLETIQTPNPKALKAAGKTLIDHYSSLIIERKEEIESISKYLAVDGYFAKYAFVYSVKTNTNLDLICKLRQDANLKYLYHGPKRTGRGRPKKYAEKVNTKKIDKRRFRQIYQNEDVILFQAIVWSVGLKRKVNVVYAEFLDNGKPTNRYAFFFSTDLELNGRLIYKYYKARFQIEFLFRDAKQYTGLTHCQARSERKLYFHFNIALTTVGIAKVTHHLNTEKETKSFSMANIKTSYFNELMLDLFLSNFHIDPELIKNKKAIYKLLDFGKIAA